MFSLNFYTDLNTEAQIKSSNKITLLHLSFSESGYLFDFILGQRFIRVSVEYGEFARVVLECHNRDDSKAIRLQYYPDRNTTYVYNLIDGVPENYPVLSQEGMGLFERIFGDLTIKFVDEFKSFILEVVDE